jgi:hypothetical protein
MTKKQQVLTTGDVVRDIYIYQGDTIFPSHPGRSARLPPGPRHHF